MFDGDKKKTAEYCIDQFTKFIEGVRNWDCDAVSYAEIHSAALFLSEDEDFKWLMRLRLSATPPGSTMAPDESHVNFAVEESADIVSGFFSALIEYMESYKGEICG